MGITSRCINGKGQVFKTSRGVVSDRGKGQDLGECREDVGEARGAVCRTEGSAGSTSNILAGVYLSYEVSCNWALQ